MIYLISTFSLPLPFLTINGVDKGEEKTELWFLVVLHSLENFLTVLASRLVYAQSSYPLEIIVFDCVLILVNILAVLVSVLYVTKLELYAGLPRDIPSSFPSYGLEVSFEFEFVHSYPFQDFPCGKGNRCDQDIQSVINHDQDREVKSFK